jgi:hypothetical protein
VDAFFHEFYSITVAVNFQGHWPLSPGQEMVFTQRR